MCTVTFIARRNGYCLGMNRDEQLTRPIGLAPRMRMVNGCSIIAPSEPGGGTWISLNSHRGTFALVNWYAIKSRVDGRALSRGEVVNTVCATLSPGAALAALKALPLHRVNAFRLIGIFRAAKEVVEWRWDTNTLVQKEHAWESRQWISSGFDEPTAQRIRSQTFARAQRQTSAGKLEWLRRLHRSHSPERGAFSTCMHRADAETVSYTEISVSSREAVMRHINGSACKHSNGIGRASHVSLRETTNGPRFEPLSSLSSETRIVF